MSRIVAVAALVVVAVVAAGCGSAGRPQQSAFHGVPKALADDWETQASAIATAASAGNSCSALRLADSLRDQVLASEHQLPLRLRSPLVTSVKKLAARLTCKPAPAPKKPPHKPPPPKKHDHHDHQDHGQHGPGGDAGGNDK